MLQVVAINGSGEFKLISGTATDTMRTCHAGKSCGYIRKSISLSVTAVLVPTDNVTVWLARQI